jgi:hypothetical protein
LLTEAGSEPRLQEAGEHISVPTRSGGDDADDFAWILLLGVCSPQGEHSENASDTTR